MRARTKERLGQLVGGTHGSLRSIACHALLLVVIGFLSSFSTLPVLGQSAEEMVVKDYPKLYNDFKSEVGGQKARYVFAIDISNSMKPYEAAVKANLQNFVNALPDGDFVTIIQMASMQEIRSIVDNQSVNASTRKLILSYISGLKFNKEGSDGFTMTSKIIEAMNQTGSSDDMKYVFMFTDFEYWTKENQFNKNAVQWASLGKKINGKDGFLRVCGLELFQNGGANIRKEAVYKDELQQIFGKVEYVGGDNSSFLNTWFNNTKANILSDRLKYVLKRKTEKQNATLILKASGLGKELSISLKEEKMSAVYSAAELEAASLAEVQKTSEKRPFIGAYTPTPTTLTVKARLLAPKYKNDQKSTANNEYNEVDKLLDPQFAEYKIEVYEGKPYLSFFAGLSIGLILFFYLLYMLLTCIRKTTRDWNVRVILRESTGGTKSFSGTSSQKVFYIGSKKEGEDCTEVADAKWLLKIESKNNCPGLFWKKPGYYITLEEGHFASLKCPADDSEEKTLEAAKSLFLHKFKNFSSAEVNLKQNNQTFKITLN